MSELLEFGYVVRPMPRDEWLAKAQGGLALSPDFFEGPGADPTEKVTPLGAFSNGKLLGYLAVMEVPLDGLTDQKEAGLKELLARRRQNGQLGQHARAALELSGTPYDKTVACSIGYALVGRPDRGVGGKLIQSALGLVGREATRTTPIPAYLAVVPHNPAMRLYKRKGFETLTVEGAPITIRHPYYLPPNAQGKFKDPTMEDYVVMGTVVTGREGLE
jgi:hypothetical protein